jgi:hypothetical protein
MTQRALAIAATILAIGAPAADAQQSNAPPGNSGIDQYLETIPGTEGSTPVRGRASTRQRTPVLSPSQRKALAAEGQYGEEAIALAEQFGVERKERRAYRHRSVATGASAHADASERTDRSALDAVAAAVTPSGDAGGLGMALPIMLVTTALLGAGAAIGRRRRVP